MAAHPQIGVDIHHADTLKKRQNKVHYLVMKRGEEEKARGFTCCRSGCEARGVHDPRSGWRRGTLHRCAYRGQHGASDWGPSGDRPRVRLVYAPPCHHVMCDLHANIVPGITWGRNAKRYCVHCFVPKGQ